jgi:hypothetical protein
VHSVTLHRAIFWCLDEFEFDLESEQKRMDQVRITDTRKQQFQHSCGRPYSRVQVQYH